jgi:hypothetical protein
VAFATFQVATATVQVLLEVRYERKHCVYHRNLYFFFSSLSDLINLASPLFAYLSSCLVCCV